MFLLRKLTQNLIISLAVKKELCENSQLSQSRIVN